MGDYLFLRKNFLGKMTHMVNNPKNAPAAANVNITPPSKYGLNAMVPVSWMVVVGCFRERKIYVTSDFRAGPLQFPFAEGIKVGLAQGARERSRMWRAKARRSDAGTRSKPSIALSALSMRRITCERLNVASGL